MLSPEYEEYIRGWRGLLPDYEFMLWDESSFDCGSVPFARHAYDEGRYAFVSDVARVKALHDHGGIYLDVDVELIRSFDDLLRYDFFAGYIFDCLLGTAVVGMSKNNGIARALLDFYGSADFSKVPNNHAFTDCLMEQEWFRLNGKRCSSPDGLSVVFPKGEFEQPTFLRSGHSVHHADGSWREGRGVAKRMLRRAMGETLYKKCTAYYSYRINSYREKMVK